MENSVIIRYPSVDDYSMLEKMAGIEEEIIFQKWQKRIVVKSVKNRF